MNVMTNASPRLWLFSGLPRFCFAALALVCVVAKTATAQSVAQNVAQHSAQSPPTLIMPKLDSLYALGVFMEYWEDPSATRTLEDVLRDKPDFTPLNATTKSLLGARGGAHWFRFRIEKTYALLPREDSTRFPVLFLGAFGIDTATLFLPRYENGDENGDVRFEAFSSGEKIPFGKRDVQAKQVAVRLRLAEGAPTTAYLRVSTASGELFEPVVLSDDALRERLRGILFIAGFMLGVMLFALAYNAILLLTTRDAVYLPYIGYVFFLMLAIVLTNFNPLEIWFPDQPTVGERARLLTVMMIVFSSTAFNRVMMETKQYAPRADRVFLAFMLFHLLSIPAIFGGYPIVARVVLMATLAVSPALNLAIFIPTWKRKRRASRLYLATYFAYTFAVVSVFAFRVRLTQPNADGALYYLSFGAVGFLAAAEIILFSFALAARIQELRDGVTREREYRRRAEQDNERERLRTLDALVAAQRAELAALRYQINPHFLFNALASLRALTLEDAKKAKEMIGKLSDYLRYAVYPEAHRKQTLPSGADDLALLGEEIEVVRNYFDIEMIRFEDQMQVEYRIAPETFSALAPCFLFQPLAENALKHGIETSRSPLRICVETSLEANSTIAVRIKNTGRLAAAAQESDEGEATTNAINNLTRYGGVGLRNVRERLRYIYGEEARFTLFQEGEWVVAELLLPALPASGR
jgi:hypothetical protein